MKSEPAPPPEPSIYFYLHVRHTRAGKSTRSRINVASVANTLSLVVTEGCVPRPETNVVLQKGVINVGSRGLEVVLTEMEIMYARAHGEILWQSSSERTDSILSPFPASLFFNTGFQLSGKPELG